MAELNRKEDQLTTADLAGRAEARERRAYDEDETAASGELKPVRSETQPWARVTTLTTSERNEAVDDPSVSGVVETMPQRISNDVAPTPLFSQTDVSDLRGRWTKVQTGFVDEPRRAVAEADKLVATVMQRLAEAFASERASLEKQWESGDNVSTEDLRVAMQRYRSFFDRLLNASVSRTPRSPGP
jgi:hypothetical protein